MCHGHDALRMRRGHTVLQVFKQGCLAAKDQARKVGTLVVKVQDALSNLGSECHRPQAGGAHAGDLP